jgi:hypothetical protein
LNNKGGAAPRGGVASKGALPLASRVRGCNPRRPRTHKASYWASLQSFWPSFFNIMMKLNSLARAQVIGPEGDAEGSAGGARVGERAAGVDVLIVSSSLPL